MACPSYSCTVLGCCQLCFALRYAVIRLSSSPSFSPSALSSSQPLSKTAVSTARSDPSNAVVLIVWDVAVLSACVLVPSTLSLTALSSHVPSLLATLLCLLLVLCLASSLSSPRAERPSRATDGAASASSATLFVSLYRCCLLLSTAVAILGVDFVVFPRRLAKTEQFGVSPMDAGVGGFMFAAALTSPAARRSGPAGRPPTSSLLASVRRQLPVLLLGCLRLLAVKAANYQEHVTEYGVHWNFFFTLAAGQSTHTTLNQLCDCTPYSVAAVA